MLRAVALGSCLLSIACAHPQTDPVIADPPARAAEFPAAMMGTPVEGRDGSVMNGISYLAAGAGPHPTAILLHGYPGEERNLDLAQAVRRSGWNVLFFHYRGAWGSQGSFSFANALEDVGSAVGLAGSTDFVRTRRADAGRIALIGHSMGGFLALTAGATDERVACIASIAGANLGAMRAPDAAAAEAAARRLDGMSGPIAGTSGAELVAEIAAAGDRYDTRRLAPELASKPVLLVAGKRDRVTPPERHHAPLAEALRAAGAAQLRTSILDADHAFSPARIALARTVVNWLAESCR